ncbi:hypothetical protein KXR87_19950 [Yokenella regensburgei]|uniref:hypothetical protein n=1 Tax=Yokenella regensburgei TaxID=158877 RepID=UPI003F188A79
MKNYKEYGGFLHMEAGRGGLYHPDAINLNSARNALKYIIRLHKIKKIYVSFFTCPVIWQAIEEEHCEMHYYDVDGQMNPVLDNVDGEDFVLCNDYFGIKSKEMHRLAGQFPGLVVDNAQAFFAKQKGIAAIYSPRKFFGLPDGGMALTSGTLEEAFEKDISWQRCQHLLRRHDAGASAAYTDFCEADSQLNSAEIRAMSAVTENLMRGIDYDFARRRRQENFVQLHSMLAKINGLTIDLTDEDVPMAYPLLIDNPGLKSRLIGEKIYVPTYWPQLEDICPKGSAALYFKANLVPLPLDQRYDSEDMHTIAEKVLRILQRE